jgi:hypothetical protein
VSTPIAMARVAAASSRAAPNGRTRRSGRETRDAILLAVAKARSWIDDVVSGRVQSFAEIAEREIDVEHADVGRVRKLAQQARVISSAEGRQQPDTTRLGFEPARSERFFNSPKVETNAPQLAHATGSTASSTLG